MNRFTAAGIALEAVHRYQRVLVLTPEREVADAITEMTSGPFATEVDRITRTAGAQRIDYFHGASVQFIDPAKGRTARGTSVDTVFVDLPYSQDSRVLHEFGPCAALGLVVRA